MIMCLTVLTQTVNDLGSGGWRALGRMQWSNIPSNSTNDGDNIIISQFFGILLQCFDDC